MTNAVVQAGAQPRRGDSCGPHRVDVGARVEVTDCDPEMPVVRHGGVGGFSARGLLFLDALASAWGVALNDCGKVVWFEVEV